MPKEGRRQEESHRVVTVPPLDQRVRHPGVDRVGTGEGRRDGEAVHDMQHRDHQHERHVEPDRHVEVLHLPPRDGAEEVDREHNPDHRDQDVDRPDELGILLRFRQAQRQGDRGADDDQLPAPEVQARQRVVEHPGLQQPLHRVVDPREADIAAEGEDHRVGVQGPEPSECRPRQAEVRRPPGDLQGDPHPHEHADDGPGDGRDHEQLHDRIIVQGLVHRTCAGIFHGLVSSC